MASTPDCLQSDDPDHEADLGRAVYLSPDASKTPPRIHLSGYLSRLADQVPDHQMGPVIEGEQFVCPFGSGATDAVTDRERAPNIWNASQMSAAGVD
jgi:hypothetical protein